MVIQQRFDCCLDCWLTQPLLPLSQCPTLTHIPPSSPNARLQHAQIRVNKPEQCQDNLYLTGKQEVNFKRLLLKFHSYLKSPEGTPYLVVAVLRSGGGGEGGV